MNAVDLQQDSARLELSEEELLILHNALNEVCHALSVPDFQTRMGATKEEARELMHAIGSTIRQMDLKEQTAPGAS